MKIFYKKLLMNKLMLAIGAFMGLLSCEQSHNMWYIGGKIEQYASQPVYISVRGEIDSTYTDSEGNFMFQRKNQYSDFLRLSLHSSMYPALHLFADSICNIYVYIRDTAILEMALIENSPESIELQKLYAWYHEQKREFDSILVSFRDQAKTMDDITELRYIYSSKLDELHHEHIDFLETFIERNSSSPVASTASFISFDTLRYKPILLYEEESIEIFRNIMLNLERRYGNIPFVQLYANTVRAIEMEADFRR